MQAEPHSACSTPGAAECCLRAPWDRATLAERLSPGRSLVTIASRLLPGNNRFKGGLASCCCNALNTVCTQTPCSQTYLSTAACGRHPSRLPQSPACVLTSKASEQQTSVQLRVLKARERPTCMGWRSRSRCASDLRIQ